MGYIKTIFWLGVTLFCIIKINEKKSRMILLCAIYFVNVINDIFLGSVLELANCFGISYQAADFMILTALGSLVLDIIKKARIRRQYENLFLAIIFLLFFKGVIGGILKFGASSEVIGDFRTIGIFIIYIIWFARFFDLDFLKKKITLIDNIMICLSIIVVVVWIGDLVFGIRFLYSQYSGTLSDGGSSLRIVQSYNVMGFLFYSLYLLQKDIFTYGRISFKTIYFWGITILFQHRSVWLAAACGLVVMIVQLIIKKRVNKKIIIQFMGGVALVVILLTISSGALIENINHSWQLFLNILSGEDVANTTAATRQMVWKAAIEDLTGLEKCIGQVFGAGYARSIGWETSPHSGYVRLFCRFGYVGSIAMIAIIVMIIRKNKSKIPLVIEFIVCILGFMYSYDFGLLCGCIIGATISIVNQGDYGNTICRTENYY